MLCTGNFFQRSHHSEQVALSVCMTTIYVLDALNVQCPTASDLTENVCETLGSSGMAPSEPGEHPVLPQKASSVIRPEVDFLRFPVARRPTSRPVNCTLVVQIQVPSF